MKKVLISFLFLILGLSVIGCDFVGAENIEYTDDMLSDFIDFNLNTLSEIDTDDNFLYSPLSLYYCLSIAYSYSSDVAEQEFETLYGITKDEMLNQIAALANKLPKSDDYTDFYFANTVYYDNTSGIYLPEGLEDYIQAFDYELAEVDFPSGDAGRRLIEKITEGTDGFLTPSENDFEYLKDMSLLINNTIYYRGSWRTKFSPESTEDGTFFLSDDSEQIVSMMKKLDSNSAYYESDHVTAAQKFFMDGSSMIFVLPNEGLSLSDIINNHNEMMKLIQPDTYFTHSSILMTIPKFSFYSDFKLITPLNNLGLNSIFSPSRTNFSLISNSELYVDTIQQITKIQVDEEGVKVAGSTTSGVTTSTGPVEIIEFIVDRPFIYIILSPDEIPMFFGAMYSIN